MICRVYLFWFWCKDTHTHTQINRHRYAQTRVPSLYSVMCVLSFLGCGFSLPVELTQPLGRSCGISSLDKRSLSVLPNNIPCFSPAFPSSALPCLTHYQLPLARRLQTHVLRLTRGGAKRGRKDLWSSVIFQRNTYYSFRLDIYGMRQLLTWKQVVFI